MASRIFPLAIALSIFVSVVVTTSAQDRRLPDQQPGAQYDPNRIAQPGQPGYVQPAQPGYYGGYGQQYQGGYFYGQGQQGMGVMQVGYSGCGCDSGAMMTSYSGYGYSGGYDNCCCKQRRMRRCCR